MQKRKTLQVGKYGRIVIRILVVIAFIYILRFLGWKGLAGLVIGITSMVYLFLSKNSLLLFLVTRYKAEAYIKELAK